MKPVLVSGVQPTGKLHIGNYLGALKNFVDLQNSGKYQCYFFIADLHSLTEDFNPKEKPKQILELMADYLAVGLDSKKSVIFQQSQISAHSELVWILNTITPMGELERMTQYKEKSTRQQGNINAGLFTYPVLMAADILLYGTKFVPVGSDQDQHLEITRTLARKFNAKFGQILIEPKAIYTEMPRVMNLVMPGAKMSKSDPRGCIFIDDSPDEIREKIQRAETDSHMEVEYAPHNRPGISNLLKIYASFSNQSVEKIVEEYKGRGYLEFKKELSKIISDYFADFRKKKSELMKNQSKLSSVLTAGSQKAAKVADKKMAEVKKKVGLI